MPRDIARFRSRRRVWWFRPLVLLPASFLLLLFTPVFLWIHSYGSVAADIMFTVTYFSLVVFQVILTKGTINEPYAKVNQREVDREQESIRAERRRKREAIYDKEVELLKKGDRTTVLDAWKLDPSFRDRHPFIEMLAVSVVDPADSEWQMLVHLADEWIFPPEANQQERLGKLSRSFLRFFAHEPDSAIFRPFANTLVLVICRPVDDGSLSGTYAPVMSIMVTFPELQTWAALPATNTNVGDLRFGAGEEIEPHRTIETSRN